MPLAPAAGTSQFERFGILFVDDIHLAPLAESDSVWALLRQLIVEQVCARARVCVRAGVHVYVLACMHACMRACMCVCVCVHVCMHACVVANSAAHR